MTTDHFFSEFLGHLRPARKAGGHFFAGSGTANSNYSVVKPSNRINYQGKEYPISRLNRLSRRRSLYAVLDCRYGYRSFNRENVSKKRHFGCERRPGRFETAISAIVLGKQCRVASRGRCVHRHDLL
jgi:hypothetical protein